MNHLKIVLFTQLIIWPLIYGKNAQNIILVIDLSLKEWDFCLMQLAEDLKRRHVCWYDSETWSDAESVYDAGKHECWELLKTLKKVCAYLYEVSFTTSSMLRPWSHNWIEWSWMFLALWLIADLCEYDFLISMFDIYLAKNIRPLMPYHEGLNQQRIQNSVRMTWKTFLTLSSFISMYNPV